MPYTTYAKNSNKYFENTNGVIFNYEEYEFISKMFYDGFQNIMTKNDYNNIFSDNIINGKIVTNNFLTSNNIFPYGTSHSSASKSITISKACTVSCLITVNVIWLKSPNVRSYDVIGAYLDGVNLVTDPTTKATNYTGTNSSNNIIKQKLGFGVSIKLLNTGNDMKVSQYFKVTGSGKVYASYQHSQKNVTLASSQKYTIARNGYGGVFLFNNSVKDSFDGMGGVDIAI